MKMFYLMLICIFVTIMIAQELEPEVTMERQKLVILTNEDENKEITEKIYQIASSIATQLNRYIVIDRSQLKRILDEQKLQHSGVVDQNQAIEIGKVAAANVALLIQIQNFGQKGVPTEKQKKKEEEEEPETGLFGWVVKEVVKAEIDKKTENVERYPNNIHTVIDGEVRLINVETSQSIASFSIHADYTGGVKAKSLSQALTHIRSQMYVNLKNLYQLSSEVLDIRGDEITLLLGKNMGVNAGTLFEIITRDEKRTVRDREITIPGKSVGFIEVKTVSTDASEGHILRKWDKIEPGYQAHEITGGIFTSGISGIYGSTPQNMRLRLFGNINPFSRFGGAVYGDIGAVIDTRDVSDFLFGFGFDLNYRLIRTSPFSIGGVLSMPFDWHTTTDDPQGNEAHTVYLPVFSPRIGLQSEIMLSSILDLVIRAEFILSSIKLDDWYYTDEDDSDTKNANWNFPAPEIYYSGFQFDIGLRSVFIN